MTQHAHEEQTLEDQRILRRLGIVVGMFALATAVMALAVGMIMG